MAGVKGTKDEIKAELLWVAQESLRTNLVHGTAGNFSARLPDGNVVLTPHIGGATYDTEANHSKLIADGLAILLAGGRPDNLVNPEALDRG